MIKGKPSYPFHTVALAVAFNSELNFLVGELKRISESHASMAIFIHAGKRTGEKFRELSTIMNKHGFHDGNSRIYWEQGPAANAILQICKHEVVDLLIVGLSERSSFTLPVGSLTTELSQKAKCTLLIYGKETSDFNRVYVDALDHRKTDHTLMTALYFGERMKAKEMVVLDASLRYEKLSSASNVYPSNEENESVFSMAVNRSGVEITVVPSNENNFKDILALSQEGQADLIVINSIDHHLKIFDRITTDQIGKVLSDLNCNLMIVHSRLKEV